ncbi:VOC family protein [Hirschia litorea]|uniref:2-oxoadipate dioxygenase/decarboxylase n=1 Tax=Hirschia litorea TaxID=1199156 RepID=A0ABW2IIG6_9PROT
MTIKCVSPDYIRTLFTDAMSVMYREEVPAYADLVTLVEEVNAKVLKADPELEEELEAEGGIDALNAERHGAIRLGKPEELNLLGRAFALMGMFPVGYYDLSVAGLPVHSTAFRPITPSSLASNPFRVFTSLLRLEQIEDESLRQIASEILSKRDIVTQRAKELICLAELQNGLDESQAISFVEEIVETFRWHSTARVGADTYKQLKAAHPLIADIVSFAGPHINHLTPRVLDIDMAQKLMPDKGLNAKDHIEGPPYRECPILLRQTAFKALSETVVFSDGVSNIEGEHTARFGEIEQRGIALTPKGRALYDKLLFKAKSEKHLDSYQASLEHTFLEFPDDWEKLRREGLAYFRYVLTEKGNDEANSGGLKDSIENLIEAGLMDAKPITYQDFLPVSAAGIFRSNLSSNDSDIYESSANQEQFEKDLGCPVHDAFQLYAHEEKESLSNCLRMLDQTGCID